MSSQIREFGLAGLESYVEMSNRSCRDDSDFKEVTVEDVRRNILDSSDCRPGGTSSLSNETRSSERGEASGALGVRLR